MSLKSFIVQQQQQTLCSQYLWPLPPTTAAAYVVYFVQGFFHHASLSFYVLTFGFMLQLQDKHVSKIINYFTNEPKKRSSICIKTAPSCDPFSILQQLELLCILYVQYTLETVYDKVNK